MTVVLAAVDDSATTRAVLQTALALAPVLGSDVEALHVGEGPGQTLTGMAESLGVPLRTVAGDPAEVLPDQALRDDVVAVVVGARDQRTGGRPAGHVALSLAGSVSKPVVVVPPGAHPPEQLTRVLVAMQGTAAHAQRLQRAVQVTSGDVDVVVVHVEDEQSVPSFSDQAQYEVQAYADEFLARCAPGTPQAVVQLRIGPPADEVLRAADEVAPDLLAIGWPQSTDPARGQVAREIVQRAAVPVLVVAVET